MLTVLHRKADGSEEIFEAVSVSRQQKGEGLEQIPALGKFVIKGAYGDENNEPVFEIASPFGAIFVMNRYGATVARYL